MTLAFDTAGAPDIVHRVGRKPDVWQWTDWRFAGPDGTFGGRWDDPQGRYRVLYTSRDRVGAYLEALAEFRPDPRVLAAYGEIKENDEEAPPTQPAGIVPARWRAGRLLGRGLPDEVHGPLVMVSGAVTLSTLRRRLAALIPEFGTPSPTLSAQRSSWRTRTSFSPAGCCTSQQSERRRPQARRRRSG